MSFTTFFEALCLETLNTDPQWPKSNMCSWIQCAQVFLDCVSDASNVSAVGGFQFEVFSELFVCFLIYGTPSSKIDSEMSSSHKYH